MLPDEIRQLAQSRPEQSGWFRATCYNPRTLCGVIAIFNWQAIIPDGSRSGLRGSRESGNDIDQDADGPFFLFSHSDDIGVVGLCECIDFDTLLKSQLSQAFEIAKRHVADCHKDLEPLSHCRAMWDIVLSCIIDPGTRPSRRRDREDWYGSASFIEAGQEIFRELWGLSRPDFPTNHRTRTNPTFISRHEFAKVQSQAQHPNDTAMAEYYLKSRTTMLEGILSMALISTDIRLDGDR
ncbi:hypothetical protein PFICI_04161 [Pestalotiopsis fici W106-1]|uniref:Uncharacterized protein n=1 Tax=Pestalotiopsis fici (strain W106-1 / CGMCC3.15140) TaxID=1229662 RepID=W3XLJ6_PESFW|nr:uncharacterized protein PFICI_04161 [Pestalotiopsis fici W106-1]ETS86136.1 hypothetical protein PFICI_04161 [Pestalotiopsis fici W106-1]